MKQGYDLHAQMLAKAEAERKRRAAAGDPLMGTVGAIAGGAVGSLAGPAGAAAGASAGGSLGSKGDLSEFTPEDIAVKMATQGLSDYMGEAMDAATVADAAAQNADTISELGIDAASQQAKQIADQGLTFADDLAGVTDPGAFKLALGSGLNTVKSGVDTVTSTAKDMFSPVGDAIKNTADDFTIKGQGVLASGKQKLSDAYDSLKDLATEGADEISSLSGKGLDYLEQMKKKYGPQYKSRGGEINMNYFAGGTGGALAPRSNSVDENIRASEMMRGYNRDVERSNMAKSGQFESMAEIEKALDQFEKEMKAQMMIENNMQSHESYGAPYPGPLYQAGGSCGGIKPKYRAGGSEGAEKSFTDYQPESSLPSFFKYVPDAYQVSNWFQSKLPMKYRLNKPVEYRAMLDNQNTMSEYNIDPTSEQGAQIFDQDLYFPEEKGYGPLKSVKSKSSDGSSKEKTYYNPLEKR
jgi:hypothetical protein